MSSKAAVVTLLCSLPPSLSLCVFRSPRKLPDIWGVRKEDVKMDQAFEALVGSGWVMKSVNLRSIFGYWSPIEVTLTRVS
jgi:hypothetical protein